MSKQDLTPIEVFEHFRIPFHSHFPYNSFRWQDYVVLESREGVRFHYPETKLIEASNFFAGAPVLPPSDSDIPLPNQGRLQPIPMTFASSTALRHLLDVLRKIKSGSPKSPRRAIMGPVTSGPPWSVVIDAVRVADILEAPELARAILRRTDLDAYHRHVIELAFGFRKPDQVDVTSSSPKEDVDLSFSQDIDSQYEHCHHILEELDPVALYHLKRVDRRRKAAISDTLRAWKEPAPHLLERACSSQSRRVHDTTCNTRMISVGAVRDRIRELAPSMMEALATAKTKRQRTLRIRALLSPKVDGCRGCLGDLGRVCLPALIKFQKEFPDGREDENRRMVR